MRIDQITGKVEPATIIAGGGSKVLPGNSNRVILFFHGYAGSPLQLLPFGQMLQQHGDTVVLVRLCGHETTISDFVATDAADWCCQAYQLYLEWAAKGYKIIPAGISMGGLLASWLAACQGSSSLLLLAPAFYLCHPFVGLAPFLHRFIGSLPNREQQSANSTALDNGAANTGVKSDHDRQVSLIYQQRHYLRPLAQLLKLQRLAKAALRRCRANCHVSLAGNDRVVINRKVEMLLRHSTLNCQFSWLADARHFLPEQGNLDKLVPPIVTWLKAEQS